MSVRLAAAIAALGLAAAACGGGSGGPSAAGTPAGSPPVLARCEPDGLVSVGERIPDCEFERLDGGTFSTGDLDRPTVINFWASWCTFCIQEMPDFQAVYGDLSEKVEFVGMNLLDVKGETRGAAQKFGASTGVRYPLAYDTDGLLYAHFTQFAAMPTTVFVDAQGVVAHRQFGPLTEEQMREFLSEHLGVA